MAPRPVRHPLHDRAHTPEPGDVRRRAIEAHPAGRSRRATRAPRDRTVVPLHRSLRRQDGSMTTEYGLLVIVGATLASLVVRWASGGAVFELLDDVLQSAGSLLGL